MIGPKSCSTGNTQPVQSSRPFPSSAAFYLIGFVLLLIACQVALLVDILAPARIVIRTSSFAASLALVAWLPGEGRKHPTRPWVLAIIGVLMVELFHPTGNAPLARMAQVGLYIAILAPLFWVSRLEVSPILLRRVLLIFWAFHTLSASVGVLQVYFPGQFQPSISSIITVQGEDKVRSLQITLDDGSKLMRPMGLTDVPGGAAMAGMYAIVFSLGFLLSSRSGTIRSLALPSMCAGLFCIYLCQVRSVLVMTIFCTVALVVVMSLRGDIARVTGIVLLVSFLALFSFVWATEVGGRDMTKRLITLIQANPGEVYYQNRGIFLEYTVMELLPEYPFGAGLGRWGMMYSYFGDKQDSNSSPIWAEIQLTGWLLDGGVILIVAYIGALASVCLVACRIAIRSRTLGVWGALVLAYNVGTLALTFNYPVFISQSGLEFWLINACLFSAEISSRRGAGEEGPGAFRARRSSGTQSCSAGMGQPA